MIKLGNWQIYTEQQKIVLDTKSLHLEPRLMDLLLFLLQHRGALVSREQLIHQVWQGIPVSDQALTCAIAKLRKMLNQDPSYHDYIETISKRGYRLHPDIPLVVTTPSTHPASVALVSAALGSNDQSHSSPRNLQHFLIAMLLSVCGLMVLLFGI